ncbi:MAG: hypothetical protein M0R17_08690 [Candidatus Omnitrophica bacterium]|nr:hypothetical protein [Candidatus Omnitrophota bacterium]
MKQNLKEDFIDRLLQNFLIGLKNKKVDAINADTQTKLDGLYAKNPDIKDFLVKNKNFDLSLYKDIMHYLANKYKANY